MNSFVNILFLSSNCHQKCHRYRSPDSDATFLERCFLRLLVCAVQQQPSSVPAMPPPVSPFAAAALLPAPESVSSQEGSSYKSSKSASDYGSHHPDKGGLHCSLETSSAFHLDLY